MKNRQNNNFKSKKNISLPQRFIERILKLLLMLKIIVKASKDGEKK